MERYPCVYMRGGTSKAIFFHEKDLPAERSRWPEIFLRVMGSPDVKQIDGIGGATSSTSKIAVISPSSRPDADIDYNFFQVDILIPNVDNSANCGNIAAAVGPYAIDEGLVPAVEPKTVVRIYNTNTGKLIEEHVQVKNGRAVFQGETQIEGVPGTGAPIEMFFLNPGGSKTGKLFPTGLRKEPLLIPNYDPIEVTIIDCANPVVLLRAADLGLEGTELTELNDNAKLMEHIEAIRGMAAEKLGFVSDWKTAKNISTSIPKVSILSSPRSYRNMSGNWTQKEDMDLCVRAVSLGMIHKAIPLTVATATGAAACMEGTIISDIVAGTAGKKAIFLGHASGVTAVQVELEGDKVKKAGIIRTARRIMDGYIYINN